MADDEHRERAQAPTAKLSANMDLVPGTNVGGYVIDGVVGTGGMGVVYGGTQPRIGKRVAIKVLSPAFCGDPATVERFEQEGRLVNEIRHPNIVDVFQFGELPDGRSFIVMEFLEGESLGTRLERGAIPPAEVIEILDEICDALDAAHEKGVIHRDLKSDNVFLVNARGKLKVKLLDFGLAKLASKSDPASISKTKSGILVGTPAYMSPEQARGKSVDHRTDIYALGCLAFKMLTGKLPFIADNAMDLIVKQLNDPPPPPIRHAPRTPISLSRIVQKMMAKAPDERPTIAAIRQTLANLRDDPAAAVADKPRRTPAVLIGAMAFLCGVIALGVVFMLKQRGSSPSAPAPVAAPASASAPNAAPTPNAEGTQAAAAPTPAPQETIEFEDDAIRRKRTTPTGSASTTAPTPGPVTTPAGSAAPAIVARPVAAIVLTLEVASQIELDGKVLSQDSHGGRFEVLPGKHTIRVKAPGRAAVTREIDVEAGATAVLRVADDPSTVTPSETPKPEPTPKPQPKPDDGVYDPASDQVIPQD